MKPFFIAIFVLTAALAFVQAEKFIDFNDRVFEPSFNQYDGEYIISPSIPDEEGEEEAEDDDEEEDYGDENNGYENYEDEGTDKRDIIKGPSFVPNIDDDSAAAFIEQENYDIDDNKRKDIERPEKKSRFEVAGNDSLSPVSEIRSELTKETPISSILDEEAKEEKSKILSTRKAKNILSERIINMLYDWKQSKRTHKHKSSISDSHTRDTENTLNNEAFRISDDEKPVANEMDVSEAEEEKPASSLGSSSSRSEQEATPENGKTTITTKKSKGKINVMVNVNINERPARKSKVDKFGRSNINYPQSTMTKEFDTSKKSSFLEQDGALQKLKADSEAAESGSGEDETASLVPKNTTLNLFSGLALPSENNNVVKMVNGTGSSEEGDEVDDGEEKNASGSGAAQGDDVSSHSHQSKHKPSSTISVEKGPGEMIKRPIHPLTQNSNVHKTYHPTHAYEEAAEAEKGETPDTVFASKIAAVREEKDNELEHNDNHLETVSVAKAKQSEELAKAVADEVSKNEKSQTNGVSKTLHAETEELARNVKSDKFKAPKAEDVRIEQLKDKSELIKGGMEAPETPAGKTDINNDKGEENEELSFTKKEKSLAGGDVADKKDDKNDDKYETLAEVRDKFKKWEDKIQEKKKGSKAHQPEMESFIKSNKKSDKGSKNLDDKSSHKDKHETADKKSSPTVSSVSKDNSTTAEEPVKSWQEEEKMLLERLKNPFLSETSDAKLGKGGNEDEEDDDDEKLKEKQVAKMTSDITKSANAEFGKVVAKVTASEKDKSVEKEAKDVTESADKAFSTIVNKVAAGKYDDLPSVSLSKKENPTAPKVTEVHATDITNKSLGEKNLKQLEKFKKQILSEVTKIEHLQAEYGKQGRSVSDLKDAKEVLQKDLKVVKTLESKLKKKVAAMKKKTHSKHKNSNKKHTSYKKTKSPSLLNDAEVIPDEKLGFDAPRKSKKMKKSGKNEHPLEEIKSLLKAEIKRLKKRTKAGDKQLSLIRGLVQQKIKAVIANGDLDKNAFQKLAPDIKELGNLLKERIKKEDLTKGHSKKAKHAAIKQQLNILKNELSKFNNKTINFSPHNAVLAQATQHITEAQSVFQKIQNANVSLDPMQKDQMKSLLTNLNSKLGEVYSKARETSPAMRFNPQPAASAAAYSSNRNAYNSYQQSPANPQDHSHQVGAGKTDLPASPTSTVEQEIEADENKKALADDEPVDTLIQALERDITETWSYKDIFPDADSLGLDNEKVHLAYSNLGSLTGLSLRRTLNRALRGEDVGLGVVGGSISKGGPFSEKGLDFVLRSYLYAIEDYWNKMIRPVTGSSMIIRDVSIGGIATDYFSFCLQNHLPDDKLTNIVLWELSANDMKRYEEEKGPKQQPLEQFTRNVLAYKAKPALMYINFFALLDWDPESAASCRNYEDEGEEDVARYYKITSLSWRNMVCPLLKDGSQPLFTRRNLFAEDNFHPSILGHAQMAYLVIDYFRTEFLKNLVKMRDTNIADAVTRLQIPKSIYVPRPMYQETYQWKPLCYTYMLVDNRAPNNTLSVDEENNGNFRYTVVREFKIRSDKIVGMETQNQNQFIRYRIHVPVHPNGNSEPYRRLGIMSFTDDRYAQVTFDNDAPKNIDSKKHFLEGTVIKTVAEKVKPGDHTLTVRSGDNGYLICALVLG